VIKVELHDRANNLVKVLSGARHAAYHPVLNSDGSGSFEIHRADADTIALGILQQPPGGIVGCIVHLLRKGQYEQAFTDRFSFVVEAIGFGMDQNEEQSAWITVAGRGTLSLLADRISWPPGFDGVNASSITSQWQIYAGVSGGAIMDSELDRSAGRFTPAITHSVQTSSILQAAKLRFDNLRLLHDALVQSGPMDAQMFGLDYQCVDVRGTDKSANVKVQLSAQDSLLGLQLAADASAVKNWIVAQGTGEGINSKLAVATDAPSVAALRRREGFLDARSVDVQTQLALTAAGSLAQFKAVDQRITTKFTDSPATQLYRDFDLGDFVTLAAVPLGISQKVRLVGYTIADTDAEVEDVSLDLNSIRTEYLIKLLQGVVAPAVGSLSVLNRLPQGSAWNDTFSYDDSCTPVYPFHFIVFIPSNVLQLNYGKLSFFLEAFRSYNDFTVTGTQGETGHSHGHGHDMQNAGQLQHNHTEHTGAGTSGAASAGTAHTHGYNDPNLVATSVWMPGDPVSTGTDGTGSSGHSHSINALSVVGIYESTVATGVTVKINGIDRTVALGGGTGFTTNQIELEVGQWLTVGAENTIDLTPSGLGRILGHLRLTGYIQSA